MENIVFKFDGIDKVNKESVVGSQKPKDVEIKFSSPKSEKSEVVINSEINTDENLWESLLDRFFLINNAHVDIEINDFGAKPSTISFRLSEALELVCE